MLATAELAPVIGACYCRASWVGPVAFGSDHNASLRNRIAGAACTGVHLNANYWIVCVALRHLALISTGLTEMRAEKTRVAFRLCIQ